MIHKDIRQSVPIGVNCEQWFPCLDGCGQDALDARQVGLVLVLLGLSLGGFLFPFVDLLERSY